MPPELEKFCVPFVTHSVHFPSPTLLPQPWKHPYNSELESKDTEQNYKTTRHLMCVSNGLATMEQQNKFREISSDESDIVITGGELRFLLKLSAFSMGRL